VHTSLYDLSLSLPCSALHLDRLSSASLAASMSNSSALVYGVFLPECFAAFFVEFNFLHVFCLSKLLSMVVLAGALGVKLPQIVNILRSGSTRGLSPSMYVLECVGYTMTVIYNLRHAYPFSTYGESVFLLAQGSVLVSLIGMYQYLDSSRAAGKKGASSGEFNPALYATGVALYVAASYYLYTSASLAVLAICQTCTIPLFGASRLPQIYRNYVSSSTGVLSSITIGMNVAGTAARIFTTWQEVDDRVVLAGILSSFALNATMLAQVLYYWNSTAATPAPTAAKATKKVTSAKKASKKVE
jgi:mannose-P-dolichol utilization defect protein 1